MTTTNHGLSIYGQIGPCYASCDRAIDEASDHADRTECPCGVWERDGWFVASEAAPDGDDPEDTRAQDGWELIAVLDPASAVEAQAEVDAEMAARFPLEN